MGSSSGCLCFWLGHLTTVPQFLFGAQMSSSQGCCVRGDEGWGRVLEGTKGRQQQPTVPAEHGDGEVSQVAERMECNPWCKQPACLEHQGGGLGSGGPQCRLLEEPCFEDRLSSAALRGVHSAPGRMRSGRCCSRNAQCSEMMNTSSHS